MLRYKETDSAFHFITHRSTEVPPDLSGITSTQGYLPDDVPLNWAVVDRGEISFYQFSDISLPLEISMG